jgi:diguanylate cyclase (GGDEF)-like protein
MNAVPQAVTSDGRAQRARAAELESQLRSAAMAGDELRLRRLLAELLRLHGMPRGRRVALQLPPLVSLVRALRAVAISDELTGLYNRRGFLQVGTRLLDMASRDRHPVHLVYFDLDNLKQVNDTLGHAAGDVLIRQTANLLRDLFPGYGVYDVIGRLGGDEFAALTSRADCAERAAALGARRALIGAGLPALSLSVGVAHFDPGCPAAIDELLKIAEQAMYAHKRVSRIAPLAGMAPHPAAH